MPNNLATPIQYLKGVGPKKAKLFGKLGINSVEDLLYYFPRRYEDRTKFLPISKLEEGASQTIKAKILVKGERRSFKRRGFSIFEVVVADDTGKISCVWFNQPYLKNYFNVGQYLILYGRIERYEGKLQMNSPEFEIITEEGEDSLNLGRFVPIYTLSQGFTQRHFRKLMKNTLDTYIPQIKDILPFDIRNRHNLLNLAKSLVNIHFPEDSKIIKQAYNRLAFEEFFLYQIPILLRKWKAKQKQGIRHRINSPLFEEFKKNLPFTLTKAQERVIEEIRRDMQDSRPMQRLLQGDVASGKTVVALLASIISVGGGYQVAFMVPTEILARQHYINIKYQISKIKNKDKELKIELLISSLKNKEKTKIYREIKEGKINLVIGTHALLQESLNFKNLGLVVIDEQHKFGVGQRALLPKKGKNPDVLIMTATPIPRTLSLTVYGDLDISVIDELPSNRKPIKTLLFTEEERLAAYEFIKEKLSQGKQAYIVYPIIEESNFLDLRSAKMMFKDLSTSVFNKYRLRLIHGRLKQSEQDSIMNEFRAGLVDLLVATTVLEAGIDVPNACLMLIEHAEHFGLAQLHQLRGRVGRGADQSYCLLIANTKSYDSQARIRAISSLNDGFRIAEEDLKIRGPGEYFGSRQHGLSGLKIANPLTQIQLLKRAREEAKKLLSLDHDFSLHQNLLINKELKKRFPAYQDLILTG